MTAGVVGPPCSVASVIRSSLSRESATTPWHTVTRRADGNGCGSNRGVLPAVAVRADRSSLRSSHGCPRAPRSTAEEVRVTHRDQDDDHDDQPSRGLSSYRIDEDTVRVNNPDPN